MALRLVLVSAVASLGLTLPTGGQVLGWKESAQMWVSSKLAEWDAQMPVDERAFAPADSSPPAAGTQLAGPTSPASPKHDLETCYVDEATDAWMSLLSGRSHDHLSERPVLAAAPEPAVETSAVVVFEPIEPTEDLYAGVAYALNRDAEGLNLPRFLPVAARPAPKPRPTPTFEPIEVGDDLYPGVAYALNRGAEGLNLEAGIPSQRASSVAHSPTRQKPAPGGSRFSVAVRLTREAMIAWASVLHGPAVVTIER
ncbi:MAG: hypothetical protein U0835_04380 [Isosphaeraceae bacterium]